MGAANSKNVAEAVSNVMNYIQQSTTADADAVSSISNTISLNGCYIELQEDFNVETSATVMQTANQVLVATQNATVTNDIQQKMVQEATSKMGSLGIGYASATNESSMLCNVTNQIVNDMNASIQQFSTIDNNFTCYNSTIKAKNLNINFSSDTSFLSDQTLNNDQVTNITNSIVQESTQKASATVQGIAGALLALAVLIAAIGYAVSKPIAAGAKSIMIPLIIVVIVIIVIWLYLVKAPPFFSDKIYVSVNNPAWGSQNCTVSSLVEIQEKTVTLTAPPLKYNFPITDLYSPKDRGNLLNMYISKIKQGDTIDSSVNGGYNLQTFLDISSQDSNGNYYWNIDDGDKLYTKVFGVTVDNNTYKLPCPLLPIHRKNDDKQYVLANIPTTFINCSPQLVQFYADSMDPKTGVVTTSGSGGDSCSESDIFNGAGGCAASGASGGAGNSCVNKCCYASSFKFDNWVSIENDGDKVFSVTTSSLDKVSSRKTVICQVNTDGFNAYFNDPNDSQEIKDRKFLYARFWLCQAIGIPNIDVYINDYEIIEYLDSQNKRIRGIAKDLKDKGYLFNNFQGVSNYGDAVTSGGNITGQFGICNNSTYKFQQFCKKAGGYILIVIIVIILLLIGLKGTSVLKRKGKTSNSKPKQVQMTQIKK